MNLKRGKQRKGKGDRSENNNQNQKMAAVEPVQIPDDFLPPTVPKEACLQRIDFTKTDPPLLEYRDHFAAVIDNLFTEAECKALIQIAEASSITTGSTTPCWERAMINMGYGRQKLALDARNCGRIIYDSPLLAGRIFDRLLPCLKECDISTLYNRALVTGLGAVKRGERLQATRLNERLRFLKYEGGEYFRPHCDGMYMTRDHREKSYFTIHLYLNGDGEQDTDELFHEQNRMDIDPSNQMNSTIDNKDPSAKLLGGATTFLLCSSQNDAVRIFPKTGSVLVFQHNGLLHAGDDVFRGVKYTMRTDIMYREEKRS